MTYQVGSEDSKSWVLKGIDAGFVVEFKGQYLATTMEETIGSDFGETSTINKDQPDFQWVKGMGDRFVFTSRLYAETASDNIRQKVELLKSFARRNRDLKRLPRFIFSSGTELSFTCFIRMVRVIYDELRYDGSLHGVILNITLQPIEAEIVEDASKSLSNQVTQASGVKSASPNIKTKTGTQVDIPGASLYTSNKKHKIKSGDTFESVAALNYGNALLGDVLRRAQPDKLDLTPGDELLLLENEDIKAIRVSPQSIPLKRTILNKTLKDEFFDSKNETTVIFI